MKVNPFRNTMNTRRAPQRNAHVAQSNAVSPLPNTMTFPYNLGKVFSAAAALQAQSPFLLPFETVGRKLLEV